MECQYCHKILSSVNTLKTHQTKTKYCLKIQGKENQIGEYICEYCNKDFTLKSTLKYHYTTCDANTPHVRELRQKVENLSVQLEEVLKREQEALRREQELRADYAELAQISAKKTTKNTINNNNLNMSVFNKTSDDIKRIVDENYDKTYLLEGQKGVAKFTNSYVIDSGENPPIYIITDKVRGNGKYKISENEVVSDNGMNGLTGKVHPIIKKKAIFIATTENVFNDDELFKGYQEVFEMDSDNSVFRKELIRILSGEEMINTNN
jgi:hypothetical protein